MTPAFGPFLFLLFLCFMVPYICGSGIVAWIWQRRLERRIYDVMFREIRAWMRGEEVR